MLEKTFKIFNDTMKMFENEVKDISKNVFNKSKEKIKIKIKKDSLVYINGAKARLLNDVIVITDDPNKLMGKDNPL